MTVCTHTNAILGVMNEYAIHRAVVQHLFHRAAPGVFWSHVPSGEKRPKGVGGKLVGLGLKPGIPDLFLVIGGRAHFLELKRVGGRLSTNQQKTQAHLQEAGAVVHTVFGLDAALEKLEGWGAIR